MTRTSEAPEVTTSRDLELRRVCPLVDWANAYEFPPPAGHHVAASIYVR